MSTDLMAAVERVGTQFRTTADELSTRIGELEKRAARSEGGNYLVAANDNPVCAALLANRDFGKFDVESRRHQRIELQGGLSEAMASITSAPATVGNNTSPGTSLVPAHRLPGIVYAPERELTLRDLMASGTTISSAIEWAEETTFTNGAAPQTEGETKGSSDLKFELRSARVQTLAHTFTASKQIVDDAPALAAYIGNRGVAGLKRVEEAQLLSGNGTNPNLHGVIPQSTAFNTALVKASDGSDPYARLRRAIQQVRLTERRANGILLHPNVVADMDLLRRDDSGQYWFAPDAGASGVAWRLPIVQSTIIDEDEFIVADWTAAQVFDRQQATVEISSEHADYFARNLIMLRIEERLALAVYEPTAFVHGEFAAVSG
ncbi:phage major capsid protein [Mesorhizobium sp. SP-1A]|uniref:phage major capsid protein n=1 Tax=Mesorhizobium sp. SP-1A TaxID=3077840 RepID=UPI0028F6D8E5|nr:phage major capsid protein [Mesorhizobium sp. SP-1A]